MIDLELSVCKVSIGYGCRLVVDGLDLQIFFVCFIVLLGLNGLGKLMILCSFVGFQLLYVGVILLDGKVIVSLFMKFVVCCIGFLV